MIVYVINFFLEFDLIDESMRKKDCKKETNQLRQLDRLSRLFTFSRDKSVKT